MFEYDWCSSGDQAWRDSRGTQRSAFDNTFNYFMFYTLSSIHPVYLQSGKGSHCLFRTTWEIPPCSKHFIKNLHTNWSGIKGLTDTSALSEGPEIKTSGSELWKVCSPSPWCSCGILQDEQQEWLPLVVSHNSHTIYTWQKKSRAHTGQRGCCMKNKPRMTQDEKLGGRRERHAAQHVASWKMNMWVAQQREPRGSYGSGRRISGFPPVADYTEYTQWETGIWQRLTFSPLIIRRHIGSLQEERR